MDQERRTRYIESLRDILEEQVNFGRAFITGDDIPTETRRLQLHPISGNWEAVQVIEVSRFFNYITGKYPSAIVLHDHDSHDFLHLFVQKAGEVHGRYRAYSKDQVCAEILESEIRDPKKIQAICRDIDAIPPKAFETIREAVREELGVNLRRVVFYDLKYLEILEKLGHSRFNLDLFGFINGLHEEMQGIGFYQYFPRVLQTDFKRNSLYILHALNDAMAQFKGDFLTHYFQTILEDTVNNFVFLSEGKVVLAVKLASHGGFVRPAPISLSFFEKIDDLSDPETLARNLFRLTGNTSIVVSGDAVWEFFRNLADRDDLFVLKNVGEKLLQFVSKCHVYPKPIFVDILEALGINAKDFTSKIPGILQAVFGPYRSIISFVVNSDADEPVLTVSELHLDEDGGLEQMKSLDRDEFQRFFRGRPLNEGTRAAREYLETEVGKVFDLGIAYQWKYLVELASLKNIQAASKLRSFFTNLPMIREISQFFTNLVATRKLEIDEKDLAKMKKHVDSRDGGGVPVYNMLSLIDAFFLEGIALWEREENRIGIIRKDKYKQKGYLGWKIKEVFEFLSGEI
ncbi:MAG: hypothetical protein ACTSU5_06080 [Promethearchaeota archaeon]